MGVKESCLKCGKVTDRYWCVKNRIRGESFWTQGRRGVLCYACRDKFFDYMRAWNHRMVDAERIDSGYPWEKEGLGLQDTGNTILCNDDPETGDWGD